VTIRAVVAATMMTMKTAATTVMALAIATTIVMMKKIVRKRLIAQIILTVLKAMTPLTAQIVPIPVATKTQLAAIQKIQKVPTKAWQTTANNLTN
jgi:hypothetical protein